jgi:hypothetical protein
VTGAAASTNTALSRKAFLRASAAAIGGLALTGCDLGADRSTAGNTPHEHTKGMS